MVAGTWRLACGLFRPCRHKSPSAGPLSYKVIWHPLTCHRSGGSQMSLPIVPSTAINLATTCDGLLGGRVLLEQPAPGHGYRFNVDSVHLAEFVATSCNRNAGTMIDLGAGVGALGLCVCSLCTVSTAWFIEADPELGEIARRNVDRAGFGERIAVIQSLVQDCTAANVGVRADIVVTNPPYTLPHAGRVSPNASRDRARRGSLGDFIAAAARLLSPSGSLFFCYPARELTSTLHLLHSYSLTCVGLRAVHAVLSQPARIVLVQASLGEPRAPLQVHPPLVER